MFGKQKWTSTAGPRQTKSAVTALSEFNKLAKTFIQIDGVKGVSESRHEYWSPFGEVKNPKAEEAYNLIGDMFAWTITAENYRLIVQRAELAAQNLKENLPEVDERISPEQSEANRAAAVERQEVAKLREPTKNFSATESAAMIRKLLAVKFPGQKFSVRSSSYAGGASVDVHWTDGPTVKEVKHWTDPFAGRDFDGMIDMACSRDAWLLPDGSATYGYTRGTAGSMGLIPESDPEKPHPDAIRVHFGSNYVQCYRDMSDDARANLIERFERDRGPYEGNKRYGEQWGSDLLSRMFSETSFYQPVEQKSDESAASSLLTTSNGIAISENHEKGGIEIRFAAKPAQDVIDSLKANGWRWSRFAGCWWKKRSEDALSLAASLVGEAEPMEELAYFGAD